MDSTALTVLTASAIPSVIGLVEVAKRAGLPTRFSPLVSVAMGIAYCVFLQQTNTGDYRTGIVLGIADGLSASGLYAGAKTVFSGSSQDAPAEPTAAAAS